MPERERFFIDVFPICGHENPKRPNISLLGFPATERGDAAEEKGFDETSHCGCIKRRPKKL